MLTLLKSAEEIDDKVYSIAKQIDNDYENKNILLIGILKGSFIFLSDLSRKLRTQHTIDFMSISSYGNNGSVQGTVKILLDTREDIFDQDVMIVEDIIDSGKTLSYLIDIIKSKGAKSIKVCSFLKRQDNNINNIDYYGFEIRKDAWVVGYGMDFKENFRTLSELYRLD
jgi:hypoxanthine phosphoribosyltransferase